MRPRTLLCAFGIVLLMSSANHMHAAYEERPSKVSVNLGVYMPSGSTLRSDGDAVWRALGIEYALDIDEAGRPLNAVSLSRANSSNSRFKGEITGLHYVKYWYGAKEEHRGGIYAGAGAGIHLAREDVRATFLHPAKKNSGALPSLSVIGGYSLDQNWYATVRYTQTGQLSAGSDFSGLSIGLGIRQLF